MRGSCLCGEVDFEASGSPLVVNNCHCAQCRQYTGSAFATWVHVPREGFVYLSGEAAIREYRTPGGGVWSFCSRCGSAVPHRGAGGTTVQIPAGVLDGDPDVAPVLHQFVDSKAPWFEIHDHLPRFAGKAPFDERLELWRNRPGRT